MRRISTSAERIPAGQDDTPDFGTAQAADQPEHKDFGRNHMTALTG
jgi:hypothetical protein